MVEQSFRKPKDVAEADLPCFGVIGEASGVYIDIIEVKTRETAFFGDGVRKRKFPERQVKMEVGLVFFAYLLSVGTLSNLSLSVKRPNSIKISGHITGMGNLFLLAGGEKE